VDQFIRITSPWVTIIGERCSDSSRPAFEYWRIERDDSLIVLPLQEDNILLLEPVYRHGIGKSTLDFPGGRAAAIEDLEASALAILKRELSVSHEDVRKLTPLIGKGLFINSSFSNQRLFAYAARLADSWVPPGEVKVLRYPASREGIGALLATLECLQCRCVLTEFYLDKFRHA
jgi:hypothetical protein